MANLTDFSSSSFDWTSTSSKPVGTGTVLRTGDYSNSPSSMPSAGTIGKGISAIGDVVSGINALSSAKTNAKVLKQAGIQEYQDIMGQARQATSSYIASRSVSGVRGGGMGGRIQQAMARGVNAASQAMYNRNIEAANVMYEGRIQQAQAFSNIANSFAGNMAIGGG